MSINVKKVRAKWEKNNPDCNPTRTYRSAPTLIPEEILEAQAAEAIRTFGPQGVQRLGKNIMNDILITTADARPYALWYGDVSQSDVNTSDPKWLFRNMV
jgi:hypothetical protein